jgi:hypothetical protein
MGKSDNKSSEVDSLALLAIIAAIALIAWIVISNFIKARSTSAVNACINNLRQIDGAKQQWALENGKTNGIVTWSAIKPYMGRGSEGSIPKCPQGGTYTIGKVEEKPTCSLGATVSPTHVLP